jgi:hypothetical protein
MALAGVGASASYGEAPPKFTGPGIGAQPKGLGLGSAAALAQKTCSPNGKTSFDRVGNGPFCVNPWPAGKNNGGATSPGVTATDIDVVVYADNVSNLQGSSLSQAPVDLATGKSATMDQVVADLDAVYNYAIDHGTYQLWGRKPKFTVFTKSGDDEASQNADAVAVAAMHPFVVVDASAPAAGGANVFSTALARRKIVVISASTNKQTGEQQSPYRWNYGADPDSATALTAAFIGRSLVGHKAHWAGDPTLASKTRTFGVVYPSSGFDITDFETRLKQNGGTVAAKVAFDPTDPTQAAAGVDTMAQRLKASGITSVVLFAGNTVMGPLLKAATAQSYSPEWVLTGYQYHDWDGFARQFDQDQMKHAFGIGVLYPYLSGPTDPGPFTWYWGPNTGHAGSILAGELPTLYEGLQYSGPTLTAANFKKGLFSVPARFGAADGTVRFEAGYGRTTGMPYDEYSQLGSDRALIWYNPDITGISNQANQTGKGKYMYMNDASRYGYSNFPKSEPKFFDMAASVDQMPNTALYPGGVVPDQMPCNGCPSSTSGGG